MNHGSSISVVAQRRPASLGRPPGGLAVLLTDGRHLPISRRCVGVGGWRSRARAPASHARRDGAFPK